MKGATEKYGADATRCALLLGAEGMDDPDWRAENVSDLKTKFEALNGFATAIIASGQHKEGTVMERWLQSKLQRRIKEVSASLEDLKTRTALQVALFETWNDIRWYVQRKGRAEAMELAEAVKVWVKMLAPFAPFICEELWSKTGETCFVSVAKWPECDEEKIDVAAEEQENLIIDIIEDTTNILKATKITPKRICFYIATTWKMQVYLKIVDKSLLGEAKMNDLMKEFASDKELKPHMKDIAGLVPRMIKALTKLPTERKANMLKINGLSEKEILDGAVGFLQERFKAAVSIYCETDMELYDPKHRAAMAMPNQPAIYIE